MSNEKNSLLEPVGKVLCLAETPNGSMIGIAQVNASLAPVGSELYVQPKDSRLKLEVAVANENALHHKKVCEDRGEWIHKARKLLRRAQENGMPSVLAEDIKKFLAGE